MTPEQLARQIEKLLLDANDAFGVKLIAIQGDLYDQLTVLLRRLDLTADGYIKQNSDNRKILREVKGKFDKILSKSGYQGAIEKNLTAASAVNALNEEYFATISKAFAPNRLFIRDLQAQTVDTINSYLLKDGLAAQVKLPLNEILNQNINGGGSFSGMQQQLDVFIKGTPDADGRLYRYAKGILRDTLFQYSRTYQASVVEDLGLEWYRYVGGIIDKTREFCSDRNGGYFHQKEIESWASLSWTGKNPLTTESSIFTYAGGYNCVHQIVPVHISIVPQEWVIRARDLGFAA
jgi:hypothetical protein